MPTQKYAQALDALEHALGAFTMIIAEVSDHDKGGIPGARYLGRIHGIAQIAVNVIRATAQDVGNSPPQVPGEPSPVTLGTAVGASDELTALADRVKTLEERHVSLSEEGERLFASIHSNLTDATSGGSQMVHNPMHLPSCILKALNDTSNWLACIDRNALTRKTGGDETA